MRLKFILALLIVTGATAQAAPARYWAQLGRTQTAPVTDAYPRTVKAAQYLLRARGIRVVADGVYGKATEAALKRFQRKNKIAASGALDVATWEALVVPLKPGARGDAVRAMQILLNGFLEHDVKVDGVYGSATKAALLKYQKGMSLKVDGIVGKETWSNLSPGQWEGC